MKPNALDSPHENTSTSQLQRRLFWFDLMELATILAVAMLAFALFTT